MCIHIHTFTLYILLGVQSDTSTQYYYGQYRYHFRHQWPERLLHESITDMTRVDEEDRTSVRQKMASDTGFTGLSILHRLHHLYRFDVVQDLVFDIMHTLLLCIIKRHLEYYLAKGFITTSIEKRLSTMPWTAGKFTKCTNTYMYMYNTCYYI